MLGVNDGQRLLVETGASLGKIAKATGASKGTAQRWKRGESVPNPAARLAMRDAFGIDPEAWETDLPRGFQINAPPPNKPGRRPKAKADDDARKPPRKPPRKASSSSSSSTPKPSREIPPYPDPPEGGGTVEDVRHLLECIRHDLRWRDLTSAARSKLRSDEARTIALVAKLEAAEELKEDRYVRNHPAFRAHCDRILAALKPFPDAAQAVIDAMET